MNTHDIDLPLLPGWMGNCFIHADQYSEHEHEGVWLKDLVTKHVIAAIEAYRKRGGSIVNNASASSEPPIGYVHLVPDKHSDSYDVRFWKPVPIGMKLYADPQPAEPLEECGLCLNMRTLDPKEQPAEQNINYKELYEQMCDRCDVLDAELAKYSERPAEPVKVPSELSLDNQRLVLWQAIESIKVGNKWDDKSILRNLHAAGYVIAHYGQPAQPSDDVIQSLDEFTLKYLPKTHEEQKRLQERFNEWVKFDDDIARLGIAAQPSAPAGYAIVPVEPTQAMLRPFYACPPEELGLAWQAMLIVASKARP